MWHNRLVVLATVTVTVIPTLSFAQAKGGGDFCEKVSKKFNLEEFFSIPGHVCTCPSPDIQSEYELLLCLNFFDLLKSQPNMIGDVPMGMPDHVYLKDTFIKYKTPKGPKAPKPSKIDLPGKRDHGKDKGH